MNGVIKVIGQILIPLTVGVCLFAVSRDIDILPLAGAIAISVTAAVGSGLVWHNMMQRIKEEQK